jgi:hypothetical protein
MNNTFELLAGFLDRFGDEVEGRQWPEPPPDIQEKMRALAQGRLEQVERNELFSLLNRNPDWIPRLVTEIKSLRANPDHMD